MGGLINRFKGNSDEMMEHGGCSCKSRGNLGDYGGNPPENWTPDGDEEMVESYVGVSNKKSIVEDMTFGEMVGLINMLFTEIKGLKERIGRLENG